MAVIPTNTNSTTTPAGAAASTGQSFGDRMSGWGDDIKGWFTKLTENGAGGALDHVGDSVKKMFGSGSGAIGAVVGGIGAFFLGSSFAEGWVGKILSVIIAIPAAIIGSELFEKYFGSGSSSANPSAGSGVRTVVFTPQQQSQAVASNVVPARNLEDPVVAAIAAAGVQNRTLVQNQTFSPYDDRAQFMPQGTTPAARTGVRVP